MNLTAGESASRSIPLEIEPITRAPSRAVQTEPRPPKMPAGPGDHRASDSKDHVLHADDEADQNRHLGGAIDASLLFASS